MRTVSSLVLAVGVVMFAAPVQADAQKEQDCAYQGDVVDAVRQARIDRIKERDVAAHIASSDPAWPDRYDTAIPLVTPWVYEMKRREVKAQDLAAAWKELCLSQ